MTVNDLIQILQIVIWPIVVLIGIAVLRPHLGSILSGAKVSINLFGVSIETTVPELQQIIEQQAGEPLKDEQIQYLDNLAKSGAMQYPDGVKDIHEHSEIIRPLRNFGLVMTIPKNVSIGSAKSVTLTPLGHLYMRTRREQR